MAAAEALHPMPLSAYQALEKTDTLRRQLDERGRVSIRDPAMDSAAFVALSETLGEGFSRFQGGANAGRLAVDDTGTLLTATGQEHGYAIPFHTEMYYIAMPPQLLFFYCETPAETGGETLICDGPQLWSALALELRTRFEKSAIVYTRELASGVWQNVYRSDSLDVAREACRQQGIACDYDAASDRLTTRYACKAMIDTPRGVSFSNNFLPFAVRELGAETPLTSHVRFADQSDTPIALDFIEAVWRTSEQLATPWRWQQGDVLILDNRSVLHGRPAVTDRRRSLLVRMASRRL